MKNRQFAYKTVSDEKKYQVSPLNSSDSGWHSRGYLPHFNRLELTQSITIRLYDSLPQSILERMELELGSIEPEKINSERREKIEAHLDAGLGSCMLLDSRVAEIVKTSIMFFHNKKYLLHAWVIMPNHVHLIFTLMENFTLSSIISSFKSYTAVRANQVLGRHGKFWYPEYFDRYIRDSDHFESVQHYIKNNPVRAGLCMSPEQWRYGSAWQDG